MVQELAEEKEESSLFSIHTHTHAYKVDLNLLCQILVGKFTYVKFGRCGHLMAG